MDLVILAGGRGSRINHITSKTPKPIINFKKISFLQHLISHYVKYDFDNIFILAGYKGHQISREFNKKTQNFVNIKCFIERKKMDTAGALNLIRKIIQNNFVLINGDTFVDFDLKALTNKLNHFLGRMVLIKKKSESEKLKNLTIKNNIVNYCNQNKFSNAGVYFFKKKIFDYIPKKKCSLENDILPNLINKRLIKGIKVNNFFIDIGTPKNLIKAKKILPNYFIKPAAFLDRDGVINHDFGHVYKTNEFKLKWGIKKFLRNLNKKNFNIFIITNQSGVAKNLYSEFDFIKLQKFIKKKFLRENIYINDVQSCFHHPRALVKRYKKNCSCRKPGIGMLKNIEKKWIIDFKKSFFVGDQITDKLCAKKYGIKFFFYKKNLKFI
jgi:D-glycero-D-manno-heptose 1,7-bisphosphate phosphatase